MRQTQTYWMNEIVIPAAKHKFNEARTRLAAHESDLDLPDSELDKMTLAWVQFEKNFDPNSESHPWKLKYLVALAFCKGWESRAK